MKYWGIGIWIMVLGMVTCHPRYVRIKGEIANFKGKVGIWTEIPGSSDTSLMAEQVVSDGKFNLRVKNLNLPAKVGISLEGKGNFWFIVDERRGTVIQGDADSIGSLEITGSEIERQYGLIKALYDEKYVKPLKEIEAKIRFLKKRKEAGPGEEKTLKELVRQKENYLLYRLEYSKRLIEANPGNELSLFLLEDEFRDSLELQRKLFLQLNIPDKESNVYKILSDKLK